MQIVMRIVPAGVLAAGVGVVGGGSAQAASCAKGYACHWVDNNFSGTSWGNSNNKGAFDIWTTGINDAASSVWAHGVSCGYTTWYVHGEQQGDWFYLNSQHRFGYSYSDSNLSDGAGFGEYKNQNFNDKISSYKFSGC